MLDEELRARRAEVRDQAPDVLGSTHAFYVAIDEHGRVLAWNGVAERVFGWTEAEALGHDVHDMIVPPSSRAAHLAGVEHFRRTGRGRGIDGPVEVEALTRSGRTVPVELMISAHRGPSGWSFHVLGQDVSARRARQRVLQLLAAHRQVLLRSDDPAEVETHLCVMAREALGADGAYLFELADGAPVRGGRCVALVAQSLGVALPAPTPVEMGPRQLRALLRDGRITVPDAAQAEGSEAAALRAAGLRGAVVEALRVDDRLLGVLVLGWVAPRALPTGQDRQLLTLLASEATLVVERLDRHVSAREAARTDALTGLLNRRAFDDGIVRALERARADRAPLVLALLDLDGFKALNDSKGHPAGDAHLQRTACAWRSVLDDGPGELYRFGGDEFALLLHGGPSEADDLLARLAAATPAPTTVTCGRAVLDEDREPGTDDAATLLARADAELYARKRAR